MDDDDEWDLDDDVPQWFQRRRQAELARAEPLEVEFAEYDHREDRPDGRRKRAGFFGGLLDWLEDWANEPEEPDGRRCRCRCRRRR